MAGSAPDPGEDRPRSRVRDFWQLDVPLAVALVICTSATVIELNRALEGNWRAWVYSVEWPMIGAFCIWMWVRFRRQGASVTGVTQRWKDRVARYEAEAAADEDPELAAWRAYQRRVREDGRADHADGRAD